MTRHVKNKAPQCSNIFAVQRRWMSDDLPEFIVRSDASENHTRG